MIDGAGTNHFVTLMIFMNCSCILKIGMSHTKVHISPGGGGGGTGSRIGYHFQDTDQFPKDFSLEKRDHQFSVKNDIM